MNNQCHMMTCRYNIKGKCINKEDYKVCTDTVIKVLGEKRYNSFLEFEKLEIERKMSNKVYHFLDDDTFETTCCGIDVTNKDYTYCPDCGCKLGEVEEVEGSESDE